MFKRESAKAIEILADMLQRSNLETQAIEAERSVIIREMEEANKNMEEIVFDNLHAAAY